MSHLSFSDIDAKARPQKTTRQYHLNRYCKDKITMGIIKMHHTENNTEQNILQQYSVKLKYLFLVVKKTAINSLLSNHLVRH